MRSAGRWLGVLMAVMAAAPAVPAPAVVPAAHVGDRCVRRGDTEMQFRAAYDVLTSAGLVPVYLRVYVGGGQYYFDSEFERAPHDGWSCDYHLPAEVFERRDQVLQSQGHTRVSGNTYTIRGRVLHAAIWFRG